MNENECTTYQNFRDAAKEMLKGKFRAANAYIKREKRSHTNDLTFHLKH